MGYHSLTPFGEWKKPFDPHSQLLPLPSQPLPPGSPPPMPRCLTFSMGWCPPLLVFEGCCLHTGLLVYVDFLSLCQSVHTHPTHRKVSRQMRKSQVWGLGEEGETSLLISGIQNLPPWVILVPPDQEGSEEARGLRKDGKEACKSGGRPEWSGTCERGVG